MHFKQLANSIFHLLCIRLINPSDKMKRRGDVQMVSTAVSLLGVKQAGELILDGSLIDKRKSFKESSCISELENFDQSCSEKAEQERQNSTAFLSNKTSSHCCSRYHNFQKHTAVLIRKLMKDTCSQLKGGGGERVARQMWQIFQSSGIKSKKIIIILFGEAELSQEKYNTLLIRTYFGELCRERQEVVREAQTILRMHALRCLTESKVLVYIRRNRHIKNKQPFFAYINEFLRQLREGPLQKFRLSLESSRKIIGSFRTASSLTDQQKPTGK